MLTDLENYTLDYNMLTSLAEINSSPKQSMSRGIH
jgi:hypothetical protein